MGPPIVTALEPLVKNPDFSNDFLSNWDFCPMFGLETGSPWGPGPRRLPGQTQRLPGLNSGPNIGQKSQSWIKNQQKTQNLVKYSAPARNDPPEWGAWGPQVVPSGPWGPLGTTWGHLAPKPPSPGGRSSQGRNISSFFLCFFYDCPKLGLLANAWSRV